MSAIPLERHSGSIPFVSVHNMLRVLRKIGVETFVTELASVIEEDYARWECFDKSPRHAVHCPEGVVELMPASDSSQYAFKYVNGHPLNTKRGLQTVCAFGLLADIETGYPILLSEMTLLTALRTASMSALAAKHLAPRDAAAMALIGNGAQSEFQALAFRGVLGVQRLKLFDVDITATHKCFENLWRLGFEVEMCGSACEAIEGVDIITTATADKKNATILSENMVGPGQYVNAVGGDCPGKTELDTKLLRKSDLYVEYEPQTRIEGDIQQLSQDHPVTELWRVIAGQIAAPRDKRRTTIFDSVGFAIQDLSALRYLYSKTIDGDFVEMIGLIPDPDDPRDLFGMIEKAA
ncbi:MAG: ornithine cyclodeaminase [Pseudomonadota bacterium]